jgi:hypothetical protein
MRWLFLIGVSLDIAGAALVAWAVASRPTAENREEALTKFGGNFWIILFREREQAQVRAGLAVLAIGFAFQFAGYLGQFSMPGRLLAALIGLAIAAMAFVGARRLARRPLPQLRRMPIENVIADERHAYGVATLDDVLVWRLLYADRMEGKSLHERPHVVKPYINAGRWIFGCPDCGANHVNSATPGLPTVVCSTCSGEFPAQFPDDREAIEQELLMRPLDERQWTPGEALSELQALRNSPSAESGQ